MNVSGTLPRQNQPGPIIRYLLLETVVYSLLFTGLHLG